MKYLLSAMRYVELQCLKAEDFEKKAHAMLDWLTEAERHLRYQGTMPDTEEVLEQQLTDHQVSTLVCHSMFLELHWVEERTDVVVWQLHISATKHSLTLYRMVMPIGTPF